MSAVDFGGNNLSDVSTLSLSTLDLSGSLSGILISRTGTASALSTVVLAAGEYAFTTDTEIPLVGDGSTAGGHSIATNPMTTVFDLAGQNLTLNGEAGSGGGIFYLDGGYIADNGQLVYHTGSFFSSAAKSTITGSSGSIICSQPDQGISYKKVGN